MISDDDLPGEFTSFIDPETALDREWSLSTGINNNDITGAPKFFEIAKELLGLWEGQVLISTNPRFTYAFLKKEFKNLGFDFNKKYKRLDEIIEYETNHLEPGVQKVKHLSEHFTRFSQRKEKNLSGKIGNQKRQTDHTPVNYLSELVKVLPNACGVYLLRNAQGDIIYAGKAVQIRNRIRQHFRNLNNKGFKIHRKVAAIDYQETESELFALLLEHYLILKYKPELNKALRNSKYHYELRYVVNDNSHNSIKIWPIGKSIKGYSIRKFRSRKSAIGFITQLKELAIIPSYLIHIHRVKSTTEHTVEEDHNYEKEKNNLILEEVIRDINPFYKGTYQLKEVENDNEYCIVEEGIFHGFSLKSTKSKVYSRIKSSCEYVFDSEYALGVLASFHKQRRLNIKNFHI